MRSSRRRTEVLQEGYAQHGGKQQHFSKPLERGIDEALMASLRASLAQLEKIARAGLVDEDMPRCVQGVAQGHFDNLWSHFRGYIEDEVYENKSLEREGNRKSLASSWSSPRTCWPAGRACPAPMGWLGNTSQGSFKANLEHRRSHFRCTSDRQDGFYE